jgi:ParB family chromosome partitioning protein
VVETRRGLGRGLSALIEEASTPPQAGGVRTASGLEISLEQIRAGPHQPRRRFDEAELEELAQSIREKGVLQPILVRPASSGAGYEIIAGERRWRAAQRAGLHAIPALVRDISDAEAVEIAIIENVQRTDLSAIEEAEGFRMLAERFGRTQGQIAEAIGKSRTHVTNTMRLLQLPESVQAMVREGRLTAGHVRPLVGHKEAHLLARDIESYGLSARGAEDLVRARARPMRTMTSPPKDPDTAALESDLTDALGLSVEIRGAGETGEVRIYYRNLEQLDEICRRLSRR